MADGKVTSVIDGRYALNQVPEALGYMEAGHARGKVIITLSAPDSPAAPAGSAPVAGRP